MAIRDTSVKYFSSAQAGVTALSGTAGSLIGVLDACLINGFGSVTADSVVVADGIATLTKSAGHGFVNPGATAGVDVGIVGEISGVTGALAALNTQWRMTVTSTTVLTWECGLADGTATGTIACKHAAAGWTKAYSGTNKAAYARTIVGATAMLLRVDDTPAQYPTLIMYEAMTDVDTGTGPAPTTASYWFGKSDAANSTAKSWALFADDYGFYLFAQSNVPNWYSNMFFGDPLPFLSSDAYHALLIGHSSAHYTTGQLHLLSNATASLMSRDYTQLGAAVAMSRRSHAIASNMGYSGAPYPNPAGNEFLCAPVDLWSAGGVARAIMPGFYCPIHSVYGLTQGLVIGAIPQLPGRAVALQLLYTTNYGAALDIIGPWR